MYTPAMETFAGSLGYISIGCWLCAQLPQVVKNITLQSCEGLSLPFLVNWLFGDLTNLLGCLLTDQLPFQTYLATYFCIIDFTLCIQYFYYIRPKPPHHHHHHHHVHYASTSASLPATAVTSPQARTSSLLSPDSPLTMTHHTNTLEAPTLMAMGRTSSSSSATVQPRNKRKRSNGPGYPQNAHTHGHGHGNRSHSTSQIFGAELGKGMGMSSPNLPNATDSYLDLYEAALDVARAAERVSSRSRRSQSRRRLSRRATSNTMYNLDENEDNLEGEGEGGMMDSFHSEMSAASSSADLVEDGKKQKRMSQSTGNISLIDRGRSRDMRRAVVLSNSNNSSPRPPALVLKEEDDDILEALAEREGEGARPGMNRSKSRSLSVVRTQSGRGKGRRAAGVAFMSLGLLARFGHNVVPTSANGNGVGRVIERIPGIELELARTNYPTIRHPQPFLNILDNNSHHTTTTTTVQLNESYRTTEHDREPDVPAPSFKRLIGRISAWACTTLYLTSRLPQIWKNFIRKSVEGLSIFLFFFAFCGNLTYVASILLNPAGSASPSDAGHYLLEALPYLLGSGGTLLFDMTIMIQSFMYGSSPPVPDTPQLNTRRKNRRKRTTTEDGLGHVHIHPHQPPNVNGVGWKNERTPLLQTPSTSTRDRDRSHSPETILKRSPTKTNGHGENNH